MLKIGIWASGGGLTREEVGAVFDDYQLTGGESGRNRGLGLRLTIVKRLTELLGHDLTVKSEPGRGSVFSIEVPMAGDTPG